MDSLLLVFGNQLNLTSTKHIPVVKTAIDKKLFVWIQHINFNYNMAVIWKKLDAFNPWVLNKEIIRLGRNGFWAEGETPMISTIDYCVEEHEWVIRSCSTMFSNLLMDLQFGK